MWDETGPLAAALLRILVGAAVFGVLFLAGCVWVHLGLNFVIALMAVCGVFLCYLVGCLVLER